MKRFGHLILVVIACGQGFAADADHADQHVCVIFGREILCSLAASSSASSGTQARESLRFHQQAKTQIVLRTGELVLSLGEEAVGVHLLDHIVFSSGEVVDVTSTGAVRHLTWTSPPDSRFHFYYYEHADFELRGATYSLVINLPVFETREGLVVEECIPFARREFSTSSLQTGTGDRQYFDACLLEDRRLYRIEATSMAGHSLTFYQRTIRRDLRIDTEHSRVVRADISIGTNSRTSSDFWSLFHSYAHHNLNERFGLRLDPPIDGAHFVGLYENLNFQTFEPEPYLELLDANWTPLASYPVTAYEITEIDRLPPLHSVFLLR